MNIQKLQELKQRNEKISMVTCYDFAFAQIIEQTDIDTVLVGDSASTVVHGHHSTVHATLDMMISHIESVARGIKSKLIIGDMPFLSFRQSLDKTMDAVYRIIQAGAQAVKLEGVEGNETIIRHIVDSGVPVMGHLGLTPQSFHAFGGHKVQGRNVDAGIRILEQARRLQDAGCFSIVLECVPAALAQTITEKLTIPTIGIGAGPHTSGQVLVLHDVLGFSSEFKPKFLKKYCDAQAMFTQALNDYHNNVKAISYPAEEHCY